MIDLKTITTDLITTEESIATLKTKLLPLEWKYTSRFNELLMVSGMGNQALREAQALESLRQEPIYEEYHTNKLELSLLYSRKETLIECGRNIRSYSFNDNG